MLLESVRFHETLVESISVVPKQKRQMLTFLYEFFLRKTIIAHNNSLNYCDDNKRLCAVPHEHAP